MQSPRPWGRVAAAAAFSRTVADGTGCGQQRLHSRGCGLVNARGRLRKASSRVGSSLLKTRGGRLPPFLSLPGLRTRRALVISGWVKSYSHPPASPPPQKRCRALGIERSPGRRLHSIKVEFVIAEAARQAAAEGADSGGAPADGGAGAGPISKEVAQAGLGLLAPTGRPPPRCRRRLFR